MLYLLDLAYIFLASLFLFPHLILLPTPSFNFLSFFKLLISLYSLLVELVIEEITEEAVSTGNGNCSGSEYSVTQPEESSTRDKSRSGINHEGLTTNSEYLQTLKDDPEAIRFVSVYKGIVHLIALLAWF